MSLFFWRGERRSLEDSFTPGWGGESSPSERKTTHLVPVFASIRHIVDFVSTLPVDGYRAAEDDRTQLKQLPQVLREQQKPGRAGVGQWLGQAAYGLVVHGNSVGYVVATDGFGFPTIVQWVKRQDWSYAEATAQWYIYGSPVPASRVVHIPWIVPPGCVLGLAPIEHYATIVRAGLSAQEYADVRRGGGIPPSVLKNTAKVIDSKQAEHVQGRAMTSFASGKPFVTGSDWDLSVPQIPPSHLKFIETLKLSATQIAAVYGIDPREIGGEAGNSLTYSTDESRSLNRANNMRPYVVRLEDAINRILPERQYVKLNTDATIRTDTKTRVEVIGAQIKDGRLNVNEARALEDRGPVPGGDYYNVPAPTAEPSTREGDTS